MLSAVAARKARLQENLKSLPAAPASPPPRAAVEVPSPKPPSKRKASEPAPRPPRKKKKAPPSHRRTRYFHEPDASTAQHDLIAVDRVSDTDQDDFSSDQDLLERTDFAHLAQPLPGPSSPPPPSLKRADHARAWSPSVPLADSSDDEDDTAQGPSTAPPPPIVLPARPSRETPTILSTFQPVLNQNTFTLSSEESSALRLPSSSSDKGTILVLQTTQTAAFLGTYSLTVLHGSVMLAGVPLAASEAAHRVFAPRSSPLPLLEWVQPAGGAQNVSDRVPPRVRAAVGLDSAVILVQELRTGVERLGVVCRTFEDVFAASRWQTNSPALPMQLEGVHFLTHRTHDIVPLTVPASWDAALSAIDKRASERQASDYSRQVLLVKGSRNSGKSTFARCLMNRLTSKYRRVAFLECDLGQSEFTPGGMVALNIVETPLFGPPFTHPSIPHAAHYVGATSPRSSPSHYIESIQALIQTYNIDIQHAALVDETEEEDGRIADVIPLVVNTMGWTKGLGADLSRRIEDLVEPSDVFEFEAQALDDSWAAEPLQGQPVASTAVTRHALEPATPSTLSARYTAADHRTLSILSYFHAQFPPEPPSFPLQASTATSWDTALPLCAQPPYEVDCNVALDRIFLTGAGTEDVVPPELPRVLNIAVVGLVSCAPGALDPAPDASMPGALPYTQAAPPPPPSASQCHGLALVRAVSAARAQLHVLTPLRPHLLARARVLVKGELELPVWGMLDFRTPDGAVAGVERGKVPFLRWGRGEGAGGERRRVRRNIMRRGQM